MKKIKTKKIQEEKKYTFSDMMRAIDDETDRIRIIIEYICNKNSQRLVDGGFNHEQFLMDIEDLERHLSK